LALRRLWGLDLSLGDLQAFAADLGSDVAFFLRGGTALCTGRGECVAPLPCPQPMHYVLILPGVHVSTAAVYGMARSALTTRGRGRNNVQRALRRGDVWLLGKSLRNDLQLHALQLHPELGEVWSALERVNEFPDVGGALLSGSGSTFFAVVRDRDAAEEAARILRAALKVRCVAVQSVLAWDDANWGWQ